MVVIAFTTNDLYIYHSFAYLVDLIQFFGTILLVVCLKICPLQPKFVKSQQTIHTCEMLVMTGNLSN